MYQLNNAANYLVMTAEKLPNKLAFVDEENSFTFRELLTASMNAGEMIYRESGSIRNRIAVMVDRTAVSLVGCFAALFAGSCYVPIDARMPEDRMNDILEQINPSAVLYSSKNAKIAAKLEMKYKTLMLENIMAEPCDPSYWNKISSSVLDIDPAYIIFTSGSTGKPKGILISHRSLIDFTEWMAEISGVTENDVLGNQAPFYFDLSVKDIYQTLRSGCTTYVIPKKLFMFPTLLADYINNNGITTLIWATSAFRLAADSGVFEKKQLNTVRQVILGGEALQAKHVNIWKKATSGCRFINLYGPTEVTVDCTYYIIDRDFGDGEPIPIGRPCENMDVILLDDELKPVQDGDAGEICVRGAGLALGYFGDKAKTEKAFIQNPLNPYYPDRLYRTGDIAKRMPDGNLVFLSRKDGQIKHMGYRIELGEIETALSGISGIGDTVCFFDEDDDAIVCCCSTALDAGEITSKLKEKLPRYMLPNEWRITDSLPMNANGKIDRPKLKENYFYEKNKLH